MRYNHAFSICFSVESEHPEGEDLTAEQIRDAIFRRVQRAYESCELREAVDAPYDTYEVEERNTEMKLKTTELQGVALDWAVAKCEVGEEAIVEIDDPHFYSTDWAIGGPIIDLERIAIWFERYDDIDAGLPCWFAAKCGEREYPGSTPLVAAMRAYVASKLGDEVEVPDGLEGEKLS